MDKLNEKAKQALILLKEIEKECGAFAVHNLCWKNDKKLDLQCNVISLKNFIEKNNLDYIKVETDDHRKKLIVELENTRLYAIE